MLKMFCDYLNLCFVEYFFASCIAEFANGNKRTVCEAWANVSFMACSDNWEK